MMKVGVIAIGMLMVLVAGCSSRLAPPAPAPAVNAAVASYAPVYGEVKDEGRASVILRARCVASDKFGEVRRGKWDHRWYLVKFEVLAVEKGVWGEPGISFVCQDAWPTPESGRVLDKAMWPYRVGVEMRLWLDGSKRPAELLGQKELGVDPMFLGVAEDVVKKHPESSALRGVAMVTKVDVVGYEQYLRIKKDGKVSAELLVGEWQYWATEGMIDVPFGNGTRAWAKVVNRYKSRVPGTGTEAAPASSGAAGRKEPAPDDPLFLGVAEGATVEPPAKSGLRSIGSVTKVEIMDYEQYQMDKKSGRIFEELRKGDWQYWAVEEMVHVSAGQGQQVLAVVIQRFKSRVPGDGAGAGGARRE